MQPAFVSVQGSPITRGLPLCQIKPMQVVASLEIREQKPVAYLCLPLGAEAGMGPGRSLPRGCLLAVGSTALLTQHL